MASLFIVSAPSGAGKTSVVRAALSAEPTIQLSVSCTTRPPRPGEVAGRDYFFVADAEFERMAAAGDFLEDAEVHGNRYGTPHDQIERSVAAGRDIVLEIDWQGAAAVRRLVPSAVSVFILPPSLAALAERLQQRGQDDVCIIARRLAAARNEIAHVADFDYVIMNDAFQRAVQDLLAIIRAERLKRAPQLSRYAELLKELQSPG
ncbi:MAG: guanylate kinase [Burkholderiales bacterium]|nr:guanylate kinase [Burkholderiales bacterium]